MGDFPYTLEVSSPGVDRPLTEPQALAARGGPAGHRSRSRIRGHPALAGRISSADADGVTLDVEGEPRRSWARPASRSIARMLGAEGAIQVEFGHPPKRAWSDRRWTLT